VIVVVDGPDPATIDFLSNLDDSRLGYVVHPESRGVSNARNAGLLHATGVWVAFCDDDDIWAPTKLAAQLAALDAEPEARWAIAGAIRVSQDRGTASFPLPPTAEVVAAELPHSNPVPGGCSGVLADRHLVSEVGSFDPRLSVLADQDLWCRLNWSSPVAVAAEPLVGYRDHPGAMTRRIRNLEDELDVMREKYRELLSRSADPFPSEMFYLWAYRRTFRSGDWRGGLMLLGRSPQFRSVVARWLWTQGWSRVRVMLGVADPPPQQRQEVTLSEYPWLSPILGTPPVVDAPRPHNERHDHPADEPPSSVAPAP
jgi:glycosyltransferase involved in cell wall biosynthesis